MSAYLRIRQALHQRGRLIEAPGKPPPDILGVTEDSRQVRSGWLFCAIDGTTEDGHAYVSHAASRGAAAAIVTHRQDIALPQLVVDDSRAATSIAAAEWFGWPADKLAVIGVTGTNGKSTTVALIRHLLNRDADVASVGTLGAFDGQGAALYEEGLTTPGSVQLQETLAGLRDRGATRVVMEVSSHALSQSRVDGIAFAASVYTNLTHDHLDYHSSLDDYLRAKSQLAEKLRPDGALVVNADEPHWASLPDRDGVRRVSFGTGPDAMVRATDLRMGSEGSSFQLHIGDRAVDARTPLLGEFNVSNALAAAALAWSLNEAFEEIVSRLASAPQVPGRMERLYSKGYLILRDYAHTPDALGRAVNAARQLTSGKLVVLFGCGGDRDQKKRAMMGRIAARGADLVVVTSDNPRTEDPDRIIDDIEEGIDGHEHLRITDRREAIERVMGLLCEGDCLLLAGKGHETYQVVGTERRPFDERQIVLAVLRGQATS